MSKRPSLVKQVSQALHTIACIGEQRHVAKQNGTATGRIFGIESLHSHQQRCISALKALPNELRPKLLRDLQPAHIAWIAADMRERGLSDAYIKNTLSSFRKLSYALNHCGWNSYTPHQLVPPELYAGLRQPAPRGSYSPDDVTRLLAHLAGLRDGSDLVLMARLILASGLRHNEIAHLRESDLDRASGHITVRSSFAKGGRVRTIALDEPVATQIRAVLADLPAGRNWLWTNGHSLARELQETIRDACDTLGIVCKGMHGLRATFAEQYILRRLDEGATETEARREVASALGHNRVSVTYRYVPRLGGARG